MKISKIKQKCSALTFIVFALFEARLLAAGTVIQTTAEKVDFQSYSAGQWKSGQQVYQAFCIYCHQTGIGPMLLGRQYSPAALTIFVRNGINTMPTFRTSEINDKELLALAKWIEQSQAPNSEGATGLFGEKK